MSFDSLTYLLFLPAVFLLFSLCRDRYRWLALLLSSVVFYAALKAPYLLVVLALVIFSTYLFGLRLGGCQRESVRRLLLWSGVGLNLCILAAIKYIPFLLSRNGINTVVGLPLNQFLISAGVSFYVFQAISYLADLYLEIQQPERHLGYFALYIAFFPKLLEGPIERAGDLLPQLKKRYEFDYNNMRSGMLMLAWGLFKKVVIADRLGLFVNTVYNNLHAYTGMPLILATYLYAFQIYCDFSGYTDMALGAARLFNIRLTQNFNSPYLATSVIHFWRRWHISFSRWILDYIFKPLQLSWRNWGGPGTALAILITFLVAGIWHGASWGFIIWGLLQGIYLSSAFYYRPLQKKLYKALGLKNSRLLKAWQVVITFNLVSFSWIFFRANSLSDAIYVVRHLFDGQGEWRQFLFAQGSAELVITAASLISLAIVHAIVARGGGKNLPFNWPLGARWSLYCVLVLAICLLWVDSSRAFIYYQF